MPWTESTFDALDDDERELVQRARRAREHAYRPYSGFGVGAAVETVDGAVHIGCNMENASYGLTLCAEAGALTAAVVAGGRHVRRIAVTGGPAGEPSSAAGGPVTPCGRCRQLIAEAAQLAGRDVIVLCEGGGGVVRTTIGTLLPHAFGPAAMLPSLPGASIVREGE